MASRHRGWAIGSEIGNWDLIDQLDIAPPNHPRRIDFFKEPDHEKLYTTSHKSGHRRKRRRTSRIIGGNCGDVHHHKELREAAGLVSNAFSAYPPRKHQDRYGFAARGYNDNYFIRREMRRRARAFSRARAMKREG